MLFMSVVWLSNLLLKNMAKVIRSYFSPYVLLADSFYCLHCLHGLMKQAACWRDPYDKELREAFSQQPGGNQGSLSNNP